MTLGALRYSVILPPSDFRGSVCSHHDVGAVLRRAAGRPVYGGDGRCGRAPLRLTSGDVPVRCCQLLAVQSIITPCPLMRYLMRPR